MMDVVFEGVRHERDGRVVLDVPSLHLASGRTTAILGPNGAGKTTMLRLIAALERPTQGRILLDGEASRPEAHTRHRLAYAFQQVVFLRCSVSENLELGLRLRGLPPPERTARIEEAAALFGIGHLLSRDATRLSEGEGRRASLARALSLHAPLVLLDEPLSGLDSAAYERLFDELPAILGRLGATTLLVTHDRREATHLCRDVVLLDDGRVRAHGAADEVTQSWHNARP